MTLPAHASAAARRRRTGFTLIELLVVVTMIGTLLLMGLPAMMRMRNRNNLRAARDEVAAMVATARAAAIQKGRPSRLVMMTGDSVVVTVDTTNATGKPALVVVATRRLRKLYNVKLSVGASAADTILPFDSRGFGRTPSGNTAIIRVVGFKMRDSLCVTRYGLVAKSGCTVR